MNWMDELGGILQQYTGASAEKAPDTVHDDFDQLAQVAPQSALADGLAEAFRSDQTPEFGQMAAHMFGRSDGQQRASILNTLLRTLGPSVIGQILAGKGGVLGSILGGGGHVTPEQAEQISPEDVRDIAAEAEKKDPSVIDIFSDFYAKHPTLIKTLGGAALAIALSKIAQRQGGA